MPAIVNTFDRSHLNIQDKVHTRPTQSFLGDAGIDDGVNMDTTLHPLVWLLLGKIGQATMGSGNSLGDQVPNRTRDNLPPPRIEKPYITHLGLNCRSTNSGITLHERRPSTDFDRRESSANASGATAHNDDIIDWCICLHDIEHKRQLLTPRDKGQQNK